MFLPSWITRDIIRQEYVKKAKTTDYKVFSEMLIRDDVATKAKYQKEIREKKVIFHEDNAGPLLSEHYKKSIILQM